MPKSRGRQKKKPTGGRAYQLGPARKKPRKSSPRWYGPLIMVVMGLGVLTIVANYIGLMPGTDSATNLWLWVGLGLIGVGFLGTTFWY